MANQTLTDLSKHSKDLTEQRFGRLIADKPARNSSGRPGWFCMCDCGNKCFVLSYRLQSGHTKSCGCLSADLARERRFIHGLCETSEYWTWKTIRQRCHNPNNRDYRNYGARGIFVCDRWLESFKNFLEDMGERPKDLTLERIDNDKGYSSENCKWATISEQNNNQRNRKDQHWFFAYNENTGEWDEDNNQHAFARRWELIQSGISGCILGKCKQHKGWVFWAI